MALEIFFSNYWKNGRYNVLILYIFLPCMIIFFTKNNIMFITSMVIIKIWYRKSGRLFFYITIM